MSGKLFAFELALLLRSRLNWLLGVLLFAALCWGAHNGAQHARAQAATLERIARHIDDKVAQDQAAVARLSRPAAARLPYWQDPSDVAGYMRYGLHAYAVKAPWPLAGIAAGQSRLLPYYLRAELDFVAPPSASFDFVNPRFLGLGEFDLAFVLIYITPLALIALGAARLAGERDSGALALIAAQATSLRRVVMIKAASLACVGVVFTLAAAAAAMLAADIPLDDGGSGVLLAGAATLAGYTAAWALLITLVASRTGAVASYLVSAGLWIVLMFVLPAIAAVLAGQGGVGPSRLAYLDELRRVNSETPAGRDALFTSYLAANPQYAQAAARLDKVPYAVKQIAVQLNAERRMAARFAGAEARRAQAAGRAAALAWLSPAMVFDGSMQRLAGSGPERHEAFLRAARAYTGSLRQFFWPRALREAAQPADACPGCAARGTFTDHARIPRFEPEPPRADAERALADALYMWLLAALLALALWFRPGLRA